ncbi:MAG: hypothetical protein ACFE0Q_00905 [Anaerolineae bacterium]
MIQFRNVGIIIISGLLFFMISGFADAGEPIGPPGPGPGPGAGTVPSFALTSADCNSFSAEFDAGSGFSNIRVNIDASFSISTSITPSFYEEIFALGSPVADTATFAFDTPLTQAVEVTLEIEMRTPGADFPFAEDTLVFEIDCSTGTASVTLSEANGFLGCNDGRLNQTLCEPIAIYSVNSDDGVGIHVWNIDRETSVGRPSLYLSAESLAEAFANDIAEFCQLAVSDDSRNGVYLFPDDGLTVVHGPDFEGKFFVFTFESYPGLPTAGTYIGNSLPVAPAC